MILVRFLLDGGVPIDVYWADNQLVKAKGIARDFIDGKLPPRLGDLECQNPWAVHSDSIKAVQVATNVQPQGSVRQQPWQLGQFGSGFN